MNYPTLLREHPGRFNALCLELFRYQAGNNILYRDFLHGIGCNPESLENAGEIPALPIEFFRSHRVRTNDDPVAPPFGAGRQPADAETLIFTSSGTSNSIPYGYKAASASRHEVPDAGLYRDAYEHGFRMIYGDPSNWTFLFLLPSYLEREGSSLIYMCQGLATMSGQPESGFFLNEHEKLIRLARQSLARHQPTMLLGVSFALLDLAEQTTEALPGLTIVETGGMKGRREELIREDLHQILTRRFGLKEIHSEYGMTELLSQAWSTGKGRFRCPPWMRVRIRDLHDPLSTVPLGAVGGIDVFDLANVHSCAFIATSDLGRLHTDGSFEVLGRIDNSEVRGCNLLVA